MANQLGPIEINCDAPPYRIVQASARIGIRFPEDVRWCRLSHLLGSSTGWRQLLQQPGLLFGGGLPGGGTCCQGKPLPVLEQYTFTFVNGREVSYFLGQCPRCRAVYWEDG